MVLATVVDTKDLDCVFMDGERDHDSVTESERVQARSQIVSGDTPKREICKVIAVVKEHGDVPLSEVRKAGLPRNPKIQVVDLPSGPW